MAHPTVTGGAVSRLRGTTSMTRWRVLLGVAGLALGIFGAYRLFTQIENDYLVALAGWLIGALIIHDGILSPLIVLIGVGLSRIPSRARQFVQGALIAGGLVTSIGILFVINANTSLLQHKIGDSTKNAKLDPATKKIKAILEQNFAVNLTILLAIVAGVAVLLYVRRIVLDSREPGGGPRSARPRPGPGTSDLGATTPGAAAGG